MNDIFKHLLVLGRPACGKSEFIDFLKLSFGQKRKTLVNNLKAQYGAPAVLAALKAAGVRGDVRAEALTLDKAAAVFKTVAGP